jgi:hypothetical protein
MSYMHDIIVDSTPDYDTGTEFIKAQMLHRIEEEYIIMSRTELIDRN